MYNSKVNVKGQPTMTGGLGPGDTEAGRGEAIISWVDLSQIIRKRLWVILLTAILLTGAAVGFSFAQTPMYQSSITILVGQERSGSPDAPREDVFNLQRLTQTMAEAIHSRTIAQAVIQELDLQVTSDAFLNHLDVQAIQETQFMQVNYSDPSPERAQQIANTIGDVFSDEISEVNPSATAITATVWERAQTPSEPVSPNPVRNGLLALITGLMLGMGLAFLLEYLDPSWRSPEEVQQVSRVPNFGVIPEFAASSTGKKKE